MVNIEAIQDSTGQISVGGTIIGTMLTLTGPKGDPGKDGTGITILGSYNSLDDLKEIHPVGNIGDAYMINTNLIVWNATENDWNDVGCIQGPAGSTPVKGKDYFTETEKQEIIKKYIYKYSTTISTTSTAGTEIELPCYYEVGAGVIDVYLNGERLLLSSDETGTDGHYIEVGTSGEISNKIKSTTDWYFEAGDVLDLEVRGKYNET